MSNKPVDIFDNKNSNQEPMKFKKFYKYMTCSEKFLLILGTIGCMIASAIYPAIAVLMGLVIDAFNPINPPKEIMNTMRMILIACFICSAIAWIGSYMFFAFFQHIAENISFDLRRRFLHHLLL